jgi:uncharacterized protein YjeT (DUF2065 family)
MWGKWILRTFTIVYIIEGVALLLVPDRMIKFTLWFADNPRNMRLGGILALAVGTSLALSQYKQEQTPQPWYRRRFGT